MRAACLSMAGRRASAESAVWSAIGTVARRTPVLRPLCPCRGISGPVRSRPDRKRACRSRVAGTRGRGARARRMPLGGVARRTAAHVARTVPRGTNRRGCRDRRMRRNRAGCPDRRCSSGAASAPPSVGDLTRSVDVLAALASAHLSVLEDWRRLPQQDTLDRPEGSDAAAWGRFLAGPASCRSFPWLTGRNRSVRCGQATRSTCSPNRSARSTAFRTHDCSIPSRPSVNICAHPRTRACSTSAAALPGSANCSQSSGTRR